MNQAVVKTILKGRLKLKKSVMNQYNGKMKLRLNFSQLLYTFLRIPIAVNFWHSQYRMIIHFRNDYCTY